MPRRGAGASPADIAVVILTMGDRPAELAAAVTSAQRQRGVSTDVVVVANGVDPDVVQAQLANERGVRVVASPSNVGIPAGRNLGARHTTTPLVAFLDDDATYVHDGALGRAHRMFAERPQLGVIALRIVDPSGATLQRWIPRPGRRGAGRSGPVTSFLGGACVIRSAALIETGGFEDQFGYALEETDLAWRLLDRGWLLHYDGADGVEHPATAPTRHAGAIAQTMRNRVWLAHRSLPLPLGAAYILNWLVITALRRPGESPQLVGAIRSAWKQRIGPRQPMSWRTVWTLSRLGRPPIV